MNPKRLWRRIQQGHLHNIDFNDFVRLMEAFGFQLDRRRGSHRTYVHPSMHKILTLHPRHDGSAWDYQVKDLRRLVKEYDLKLGKEHA